MYRTHFLSKDLQKLGEYKHYAAILSHLKNKSKTEYYNMQFTCTLVKRKTKGQTSPTKISQNNRTFTQEKDIAELFNNLFVNIGPTLAKEIETDHTDPLQYYIESTPSNSFYLAPVTQAQVFTLFAGLKGHNVSLTSPNKLIKLATKQLSAPFTEIYNKSILSVEFSEIFKISKVTPIFKSGSLSELGNHRPIAVISPFSKVLERLVYDQFTCVLSGKRMSTF